MIRVFLPLAIIASIYFGPMFSETTSGSATGERVTMISGDYFIGNAVNCAIRLNPPIGEECASDGQLDGSSTVGDVISWASILAAAAAVLGVVGILPFVGRITSVVTLLAGVGGLGAMGLFLLTMMGTNEGLAGVQWGAYLAAGMSLLTMISGLSGMRGR